MLLLVFRLSWCSGEIIELLRNNSCCPNEMFPSVLCNWAGAKIGVFCALVPFTEWLHFIFMFKTPFCWHSLRLWLLTWRSRSSHLLITFIQREGKSRIPIWGYFRSQFCLGLVATFAHSHIPKKQIDISSPGIVLPSLERQFSNPTKFFVYGITFSFELFGGGGTIQVLEIRLGLDQLKKPEPKNTEIQERLVEEQQLTGVVR